MVVAILLIGIVVGLGLSVTAWMISASFLLAILAYSLGGALGCVLAGVGLALCRSRGEATQ